MKPIRRSKRTRYLFRSRWKRAAMGVMDGLGRVLFAVGRRKHWDLSGVRRVLVIRMDQIGDALFAAPVVECLRELLPSAKIDFLAGPWSEPLVKTFPHVSETLVFKSNWYDTRFRLLECMRSAWRLLKTLRANRYDLGIDLRGDFRNILLMRLAGISQTLGYGITGGKFLLHRTVRYDFSAHQLDLNLRLVEEVARGLGHAGHTVFTSEHRRTKLFCPEGLREAVVDRGLLPVARPRILVHLEAGYPSKRWSRERYAELIAALCARGPQVVLVGIEPDGFCQHPLLKDYQKRITDLRGKTNLLELFAVIAESDLLIGNDSAPAHLAAGLGRPCVVLFSGANDPTQWRPLGDDVHLLFHTVACSPCESRECAMPTHECLDAIRVHEVEGVVMEILSAKELL